MLRYAKLGCPDVSQGVDDGKTLMALDIRCISIVFYNHFSMKHHSAESSCPNLGTSLGLAQMLNAELPSFGHP